MPPINETLSGGRREYDLDGYLEPIDLLQNNKENPRQLSPKQKSNDSTKLVTQELVKHTLTFNLSPTIDWNAITKDF